jgi:hypothetical protein
MKKSIGMLVLRRETIKLLASVHNVRLGHVHSGEAAVANFDSNTQSGINCPAQVLVSNAK